MSDTVRTASQAPGSAAQTRTPMGTGIRPAGLVPERRRRLRAHGNIANETDKRRSWLIRFAAMERSVAELVGETDVETLSAAQVVDTVLEAPPSERRPRLLVPEGGDRPPRPAPRARAQRTGLRSRHPCPLPGDLRRLARDRAALRHRRRGLRGPVPRTPGGDPRRRAVGDESRPVLLDPEARPARARALGARGMDHRRPPRSVGDARGDAEARLGRAPRALEGEPARRLDG